MRSQIHFPASRMPVVLDCGGSFSYQNGSTSVTRTTISSRFIVASSPKVKTSGLWEFHFQNAGIARQPLGSPSDDSTTKRLNGLSLEAVAAVSSPPVSPLPWGGPIGADKIFQRAVQLLPKSFASAVSKSSMCIVSDETRLKNTLDSRFIQDDTELSLVPHPL